MRIIHCVTWKEENLYVSKAIEVEVASQGSTEEEAIRNLKEALELYFEDYSDIETIQVKEPKLQDLSISV